MLLSCFSVSLLQWNDWLEGLEGTFRPYCSVVFNMGAAKSSWFSQIYLLYLPTSNPDFPRKLTFIVKAWGLHLRLMYLVIHFYLVLFNVFFFFYSVDHAKFLKKPSNLKTVKLDICIVQKKFIVFKWSADQKVITVKFICNLCPRCCTLVI